MAYAAMLALHSVLRWAVLAAVGARIGLAATSLSKPFGVWDRRLGIAAIITLDVQFLLGVGMFWGVSPATTAAMADIGAAMKEPFLRFWLVEHPIAMIAAVVLAHVGNVRIKRAVDDAAKHKAALIFYSLALVLILAAIPWPFRGVLGRPLFPGL